MDYKLTFKNYGDALTKGKWLLMLWPLRSLNISPPWAKGTSEHVFTDFF